MYLCEIQVFGSDFFQKLEVKANHIFVYFNNYIDFYGYLGTNVQLHLAILSFVDHIFLSNVSIHERGIIAKLFGFGGGTVRHGLICMHQPYIYILAIMI